MIKHGIVLIGAPCSGKSTIGRTVADRTNMGYISSGDIARQAGKNVTKLLSAGKLAPEDIIITGINKMVNKYDSFILDGFPRHMAQYEYIVDTFHNCELGYAIIDTTLDSLISRSKLRLRDDDGLDTFIKRYNWYINNTLPVIQAIKSQEKYTVFNNIHLIDRDDIVEQLCNYIAKEVNINVNNCKIRQI